MELLVDADPVIRQLIPHIYEAAGLKLEAAALRSLDKVIGLKVVYNALYILREASQSADESCTEQWTTIIRYASFWSEGALVAAIDSEHELFLECLYMIRKTLDDAQRLMAMH